MPSIQHLQMPSIQGKHNKVTTVCIVRILAGADDILKKAVKCKEKEKVGSEQAKNL
jgi:hypothetical protein